MGLREPGGRGDSLNARQAYDVIRVIPVRVVIMCIEPDIMIVLKPRIDIVLQHDVQVTPGRAQGHVVRAVVQGRDCERPARLAPDQRENDQGDDEQLQTTHFG